MEGDRWLEGEAMSVHLLLSGSKTLRAGRSNRPSHSPLFSSSPWQVLYRRRLTHFSSLPESYYLEKMEWCGVAGVLGGWVYRTEQKLLIFFSSFTEMEDQLGLLKKACRFFFFIRYCRVWYCFSNSMSWSSIGFASVQVHTLTLHSDPVLWREGTHWDGCGVWK